jgi:hypothetical protein
VRVAGKISPSLAPCDLQQLYVQWKGLRKHGGHKPMTGTLQSTHFSRLAANPLEAAKLFDTDHFAVLGVSQTASDGEIKKGYVVITCRACWVKYYTQCFCPTPNPSFSCLASHVCLCCVWCVCVCACVCVCVQVSDECETRAP